MGNLLFSVSFSRFHSKLRLEMNQTKVSPKFFNEKFRKQLHLFTCILPDYALQMYKAILWWVYTLKDEKLWINTIL